MNKQLVLFAGVLCLAVAANAQYSLSGVGASVAAGELNSKTAFQTVSGPPTALTGSGGKDFAYDFVGQKWYIAKISGTPATWAQIEELLTFTAGLTRSGQSITCAVASGSVAGCLSTADWTAFNAKLTNPFTTTGDLSMSTGGTTGGRLAAGAADTFLQGNGAGTVPSYGTLANCVAAGGVLQYSTSTHLFSCHTLTGADIPNNVAIVPVTFSATPTFTVPSGTTDVTFTIASLTGNITSSAFVSTGSPVTVTVRVCQDATGSRTLAWPANFINFGVISSVINKCSSQTGTYDGTNVTARSPMITDSTPGGMTGNAKTATALAANGANCSAGSYALGVDAAGNAEGCTVATGSGTVTVVGSGSLTSTAFATGGGAQAAQTPSATSTLDASGNAVFAGSITAPIISTGPGAVGALIGAYQSQAAAVTQFGGVPGLYFNATDLLPKFLDASGLLTGVMVAPDSARSSNQFCTHVSTAGVCVKAPLVGADLPLPTSSTLGGVKSHVSCGVGNHIDSIGTDGVPTCTADATTGGSVSVTTAGDLQGRDGSGPARIPVGTEGQMLAARLTTGSGLKVAWEDKPVRPIKVLFDAGEGATLTAGAMVRCGLVDYAGTIKAATITADVADSAVVDVKTVVYGSYTGPASASSIAASAKPTLTSAITAQDSTLTGWTTALAANTYVCFSMTGASAAKWVEVDLKVLPN